MHFNSGACKYVLNLTWRLRTVVELVFFFLSSLCFFFHCAHLYGLWLLLLFFVYCRFHMLPICVYVFQCVFFLLLIQTREEKFQWFVIYIYFAFAVIQLNFSLFLSLSLKLCATDLALCMCVCTYSPRNGVSFD